MTHASGWSPTRSTSRNSRRLAARGGFRARLGLAGPVVAFLGKITPRKRVDHLIRAFARLRTSGAALVVAGNDMGAGAAARAAARDAGVGDRTHFVGLLEGAAATGTAGGRRRGRVSIRA